MREHSASRAAVSAASTSIWPMPWPRCASSTTRVVIRHHGAPVVRHWYEEVGCGPNERPAVVGDDHVSPRIGEHVFEPPAKCLSGLRMAYLVEQASELIGILRPSRANCRCRHLRRSMNAYLRALLSD